MSLPKRITGVRYLGASAFNSYVSFADPNQGQASDGTPKAAVTVASGIHANVQPWRSKERDAPQERVGQSSYKVVIRYPQSYSVNTGMQILFNGQTAEIESIYDPDGQQVELHIWCWVNNAVVS